MIFDRKDYPDQLLIQLYQEILKPRLIEEKMLILLRQNEISKWFSGIGQEAISTGVVCALQPDEYILPLHRNLGIFTGRGIPFNRLFSQFQGKMAGFTKGRDRSFHFGSQEYHIVGMISHLGPQLSVADGIALADQLCARNKVTVVFSGDGGASEGEFHEALNIAAVWSLPVMFIIENNGYGLSTPSSEQFRFNSFCDKGPAYGIETRQVDGNNVLEVYSAIQEVAKSMRENPRPFLVEAMTFRMRGHEEASGTKYVPEALFEKWSKKDPVEKYEEYVITHNVIEPSEAASIRKKIKSAIDTAWAETAKDSWPVADTATELNDMYAPHPESAPTAPLSLKTTKRFIDAVSDGLTLSLEMYPQLILMGQDIAEYGGVFKVTDGMVTKFGKSRIRNTPLCESGVIGVGLGLSVQKMKSVIEMQFADFVTCGFNQIVNNLAKIYYRWGQNADVVIRMPTGAGVAAGPFHSQSTEAWFFHTPGLKIVYPSTPAEAKGLIIASVEDPNPVLFYEHKAMYRSISEEVPDGYYTIPIGKARLVQQGDQISIITYGMGVHWSLELLKANPEISADLLDLRSLLPWDKQAVQETVKKTGKVIVLSEDSLTGSIPSEIASWIAEHCFEYLDAPVFREGSLDTAVPFNSILEKNFLPQKRLKDRVLALISY